MKKRFSEEQIIKAIKQHEAGTKVEDICRQLGISNGTEFTSKAMFWSKETKVKLSFTHFRFLRDAPRLLSLKLHLSPAPGTLYQRYHNWPFSEKLPRLL